MFRIHQHRWFGLSLHGRQWQNGEGGGVSTVKSFLETLYCNRSALITFEIVQGFKQDFCCMGGGRGGERGGERGGGIV